MIFLCVKRTNTKVQIYKYTNTAYDKVPERPSMCYNTVAVLSLCQLSIVECSKSTKDFCTKTHPGLSSSSPAAQGQGLRIIDVCIIHTYLIHTCIIISVSGIIDTCIVDTCIRIEDHICICIIYTCILGAQRTPRLLVPLYES